MNKQLLLNKLVINNDKLIDISNLLTRLGLTSVSTFLASVFWLVCCDFASSLGRMDSVFAKSKNQENNEFIMCTVN